MSRYHGTQLKSSKKILMGLICDKKSTDAAYLKQFYFPKNLEKMSLLIKIKCFYSVDWRPKGLIFIYILELVIYTRECET